MDLVSQGSDFCSMVDELMVRDRTSHDGTVQVSTYGVGLPYRGLFA
jgi:hypothetical protein